MGSDFRGLSGGQPVHTQGPQDRRSGWGVLSLTDQPWSPRPPRLGRGVQREPHGLPQVQLTISPLPALGRRDKLQCVFGNSTPHPARMEGDTIVCNSPSRIPSTPPGQGEAPSSSHQLALVPPSCTPWGHLPRLSCPSYDAAPGCLLRREGAGGTSRAPVQRPKAVMPLGALSRVSCAAGPHPHPPHGH